MISKKLRFLAAPLLGALLLAGCRADDDLPITAPVSGVDDGLLARYVALGNSVTAGMQSAGINDSLQLRAYPVLIARAAGEPFYVPLLAQPGCPAPLTQPVLLGSATTAPPGAPACALRAEPFPPPYISNVAFPGAYIAGASDNAVPTLPASASLYKTLILGGRTQVEAMADANPTFVSVWLGNNDALGAAVAGVPQAMTPVADFTAGLNAIVEAIKASGAQGAAFIAPVNALMFAPRFQPGAYFWALAQQGALPVPVSDTCSPLAPGGRYFVAIDAIGAAAAAGSSITCVEDAPYVTSTDEYVTFAQTVGAYKAAIESAAKANGWIYLDVDQALAGQASDPDLIRKCQGLATATLATFAQAVAQTCPNPSAPNFFGAYISYDATHPSSLLHQQFANVLIGLINGNYGTNIPTL